MMTMPKIEPSAGTIEYEDGGGEGPVILTVDQRVRVFVSSTLGDLREERAAVSRAVESLRLTPVMFEVGARPHPPRALYRSLLERSDVFIAVHWQRYGKPTADMEVSGLEDEYLLAEGKPRLVYIKGPAPEREPRLQALLDRIRDEGQVSYKRFGTPGELERLVADDLALLLSERFQSAQVTPAGERAAHPAPLPAETTSFVGRRRELAELTDLLGAEDVRVVTLTGPGGIGKTRLGLELARRAAPAFPDGVAFVPLELTASPDLVPDAIARALGLRTSGPQPRIEALKDHFGSRSMLLVLDNLEHLMPATPVVRDLLEAAPRLKVVTTSREALRVRAEYEFAVPPLAESDGVALFSERARAVRNGSRPRGDEEEEEVVRRICRRLEGVPLAIELAAARSRLFGPEALLERLDRRLDFLVSGARDLPERQRALRTTLEWSHELLRGADRPLFARLGIFAGAFTLEAAAAVAGGEEAEVLEGVASLVDKSLVRAIPAPVGAGGPRFDMLGMVQEYALERLRRSGELERVRARHAAFHLDVSLAAYWPLRGAEQRRWLARLDHEAADIAAALDWLEERKRFDDLAEMLWALWPVPWLRGGLHNESRRLAGRVLAEPGLSPRARARLLAVAGIVEMIRSDSASGPSLEEALAGARETGDEAVVAYALCFVGVAAPYVEGDDARRRRQVAESLPIFRRLGDRWGEALALCAETWLDVYLDRFAVPEETYRDAVSIARETGDDLVLAMNLQNLAEHEIHRGRLGAAAAALAEALDRYRTLGTWYPASYAVEATARLAARGGLAEVATRLLGAAEGLRVAMDVPIWLVARARHERLVDELRRRLPPDAFDRSRGEGRGLGLDGALDAGADALGASLRSGAGVNPG